jgi:hypothetical protein
MRRRSTYASLALVALAAAALPARAQSGPPRPSPKATVSQVAGLTEMKISYSSPSVRERQVWGALVPYDEVWRTGANEATAFEVSTDVTVEGKPLPAGKYALFTIPGKERWTVIFNKTQQWGAFNYELKDDVLRVEVVPRPTSHHERLRFTIEDFTDTAATVILAWEKVAVPVKLTFDTPKIALAAAEQELRPSLLINWARWLQQNDVAADKALAWVQRGTATEQGARSYWGKAVEARLLAEAGKVAEAKAAAAAAVPLAANAPDAAVAKADAEKLQQEAAGWK